ncbi:Fc receptor-like protein 5 [Camelus dromedarius]|uniref:Fc receptor-like protein 5 n=1 Tax=Camelus dromedarius TaxID=9838 RepID=A0A5N4CN25_CAMDR|nr:Fc receptor-like protein 5 [Camelus dromedarius]
MVIRQSFLEEVVTPPHAHSLSSTVTEPKPVISLHPPWTTIFQGERVTLTCNAFYFSAREKIKWYHWYIGETSHETFRNTLEVQNSGEYRCRAQDSPLSNRVHLLFSPANLILQAPLDVFEEESVVLRCRTRAKAGLNAVMLYKNGKVLKALENISDFTIHQASLKDNGIYHCTGIKEDGHYVSSNSVEIQVQELFPPPVLTASPTYPIEGRAVTLTCLTQPVPQRPDVQLQFQFQFLRDNWTLESDWRSSPEFQITTVWREDSRSSYWCQARRVTSLVQKKSQRFQMYVRRVTAKIQIYTYPELALEGQKLVIICSVGGIQEPITFFWYKKTNKLSRRTKIHTSSEREFRIPVLTDSHAGEYCCVARNRHYSFFSDLVTVSVKVPVSPPILTLSPLGARTLEGDVVTLLCEVQRGSLPILYQLFHKGVLLKKIGATSWRTISFQLFLTEEHSGNYYCTADNGLGPQHSKAMSLSVFVPVSRPVLTLRTPRAQTVEGDMVELHCEAQRGSPPIQYQLFHKDVALGSSSSPSGGGATFNLFLKEEHSGNYICQANNGLRVQHSDTVSLSVRVPVSRPVLTLRTPRAQAVEGDVVELHCEAQRGSSPILYQFFHEDVALGSRSSPSGGGAPFNLSLMAEHSGNYSCKADNGLGAQRSEVMTLSVIVPVSRPVLTLKVPGAQAVEGDMVELLCEAQRGSPPILYRFYHENVTLESSVSHSGQGVSFNLSVTAEHSGNYSCEVDNGLGPQCSEAVTLHITGLTGSRIGPVATGVTGGLLSIMGLAAVALLLYGWPLRKAGRRPTSNSSRNPSDSDSQEPTYHNVPAWIELQPVYSNVNPKGGDIVYAEVQSVPGKSKHAVASAPGLLKNTMSPTTCLPSHLRPASLWPSAACSLPQDSSVIYSQVKGPSTPASVPQLMALSAPHR